MPLLLETGVSAQILDCYKYLRVEDLYVAVFPNLRRLFSFFPTISHHLYDLFSVLLLKAKGSNWREQSVNDCTSSVQNYTVAGKNFNSSHSINLYNKYFKLIALQILPTNRLKLIVKSTDLE